MASSVKNEVHFHSTAFKCANTDGSATSDACFGEDLCRWLIRELRGRGGHNPSDKPTKGDFCWYVAFHVGGAEHRFFVRFVPQNPSAGEEWRGWLERRTGFIGSLFWRQRRAILPYLRNFDILALTLSRNSFSLSSDEKMKRVSPLPIEYPFGSCFSVTFSDREQSSVEPCSL